MLLLDFYKSYILWQTKENSYGRFAIESSLQVNGESYYLGSGVMACHMYNSSALLITPPYRYEAVFSEDEYHIFRTGELDYFFHHSSGRNKERFASLDIMKHNKMYVPSELNGTDRIKEEPFVTSMDLRAADKNVRIRFPVKHMNYSETHSMFQFETGPVVLPDLGKNTYSGIEDLKLYYLAFNDLTKVEFIPVNGQKDRKIFSVAAKINLYKSIV